MAQEFVRELEESVLLADGNRPGGDCGSGVVRSSSTLRAGFFPALHVCAGYRRGGILERRKCDQREEPHEYLLVDDRAYPSQYPALRRISGARGRRVDVHWLHRQRVQ